MNLQKPNALGIFFRWNPADHMSWFLSPVSGLTQCSDNHRHAFQRQIHFPFPVWHGSREVLPLPTPHPHPKPRPDSMYATFPGSCYLHHVLTIIPTKLVQNKVAPYQVCNQKISPGQKRQGELLDCDAERISRYWLCVQKLIMKCLRKQLPPSFPLN